MLLYNYCMLCTATLYLHVLLLLYILYTCTAALCLLVPRAAHWYCRCCINCTPCAVGTARCKHYILCYVNIATCVHGYCCHIPYIVCCFMLLLCRLCISHIMLACYSAYRIACCSCCCVITVCILCCLLCATGTPVLHKVQCVYFILLYVSLMFFITHSNLYVTHRMCLLLIVCAHPFRLSCCSLYIAIKLLSMWVFVTLPHVLIEVAHGTFTVCYLCTLYHSWYPETCMLLTIDILHHSLQVYIFEVTIQGQIVDLTCPL